VTGGLAIAITLVVLGVMQPSWRFPSNPQESASNDLTRSFDIQYPVLHLEAIDTQLKEFTDSQTNKFVEKIKDKPYDSRNKLTINYTMPHHGEKIVSVVFTKTEEIVDQQPVTTEYRRVYDVASGKKLAVNDLFRADADARGVLANIFYDYFRQNDKAQLSPDQHLKLFDFSFDHVRDFLVYENSLVIYINPADLASKEKPQSVQIQKNVISSVLKDEYASHDQGKAADTQPEVTYAINEFPKRSAPNASSGKRLALTFDDGPSEHTGRLLDVLAKYRSRATFYVLGHLAQAYAGELQRMVRDGHEIGNHTWLHANLTHLDSAAFNQQIGDTQRAIQSATGGYTPRTYRPPYGATNDAVRSQASAYGLHEVLWNVDPNDWQIHDSQLMYDRIMGGAADGRVILLHDIYGSSADAAIRAIPELLAQGYQLVTVSELYGY
jgi:peptidoglycan/xylan/chitin deacetylase (PgdA/CDA1 family)